MSRTHAYEMAVEWTGNTGAGTAGYGRYERSHALRAPGKPPIAGSSDPAFRGDASRYNPEELLLGAISACHMLWFLHLCAEAGVVVLAYTDRATAVMQETPEGGGRFTEAVLHPSVLVADAASIPATAALHEEAHRRCYIAASLNFPVRHRPACSARPV